MTGQQQGAEAAPVGLLHQHVRRVQAALHFHHDSASIRFIQRRARAAAGGRRSTCRAAASACALRPGGPAPPSGPTPPAAPHSRRLPDGTTLRQGTTAETSSNIRIGTMGNTTAGMSSSFTAGAQPGMVLRDGHHFHRQANQQGANSTNVHLHQCRVPPRLQQMPAASMPAAACQQACPHGRCRQCAPALRASSVERPVHRLDQAEGCQENVASQSHSSAAKQCAALDTSNVCTHRLSV